MGLHSQEWRPIPVFSCAARNHHVGSSAVLVCQPRSRWPRRSRTACMVPAVCGGVLHKVSTGARDRLDPDVRVGRPEVVRNVWDGREPGVRNECRQLLERPCGAYVVLGRNEVHREPTPRGSGYQHRRSGTAISSRSRYCTQPGPPVRTRTSGPLPVIPTCSRHPSTSTSRVSTSGRYNEQARRPLVPGASERRACGCRGRLRRRSGARRSWSRGTASSGPARARRSSRCRGRDGVRA